MLSRLELPTVWPERPRPYCDCFRPHLGGDSYCSCGEEVDVKEWTWEPPESPSNSICLSRNNTEVLLHPHFSIGTAVVRGNKSFNQEYTYYWEVKMMTEPYGTDVMVGIGSENVDISDSVYKFCSFLGGNDESFGLSYTGALCHGGQVIRDSQGFVLGSIIGVKVDMWQGTLEFFINRRGLGVSHTTLRRHRMLFPMVCSTAAQSVIRLIYASSYKSSLLVNAGKILANSVSRYRYNKKLPPGICKLMRNQFFLTLQTQEHPKTKADNVPREPEYMEGRNFIRMW